MAMTAVIASSCIYDDEGEAYQVGEPAMLAKFIISVGNDQGGSTIRTKQTTEVTQAQSTPVFRGMQDIVMIPFNISGTKVTASDARLSLNLTLPATGSIPQVTADNTINSLNATSNSQVYQDVSIALGTNAFLCYGKATGDDNAANGRLDCAGLENGDPDDITFTPKAIYTPADPQAPTPTEATDMVNYLTAIANTTGWVSGNIKMRLLRTQFLSQHAGSAPNVLATLQDLYDALMIEPSGTLRDAIIANMKIGTATDDVLHLTNGKLEWNDGVSFKDYPASLGLPDGAAYIYWDDSSTQHHFVPVYGTDDNIGNEMLSPSAEVDLMHYATPAPLYYRANTKIKVSDNFELEHYQDANNNWSAILNEYQSGNTITPSTKSVALIEPLEYAVARMDVAVKAATATLTDKEDVETNASDLELTGVLIGGQYAVDFEFTPTGTAPYIIYDNNINPADATTTPVTPITLETNREKAAADYIVNHTLVLPSKKDEKVNVYLEFKNNSDHDITTWDGTWDGTSGTRTGLVPPGCKLYLAGTIELGTGQEYVFVQDHVTTFTVTVSTLKNACNVVPSMDVGQPFTIQVAIKDWEEISTEAHDLYNW